MGDESLISTDIHIGCRYLGLIKTLFTPSVYWTHTVLNMTRKSIEYTLIIQAGNAIDELRHVRHTTRLSWCQTGRTSSRYLSWGRDSECRAQGCVLQSWSPRHHLRRPSSSAPAHTFAQFSTHLRQTTLLDIQQPRAHHVTQHLQKRSALPPM